MELKLLEIKKFILDKDDKDGLDIAVYILEKMIDQLSDDNCLKIEGFYHDYMYDNHTGKGLKDLSELLRDIKCGIITIEEGE